MSDTSNQVKSEFGALRHEIETHADKLIGDTDTLLEAYRRQLEGIEEAEKSYSDYHRLTLDALLASLWNPIISKFTWRKQQSQQRTDEMESDRRKLDDAKRGTRKHKDDLNKMFGDQTVASASEAEA